MNYLITIFFSSLGIFFALSKPRWGIILILAMLYFPIFSLFNLGSIQLSVSTLPVLALFVNAFWKLGRNSREIKIATWQWVIMIGMAISIILSAVGSQSPSLAWSIIPNQFLYILIIFSVTVLCRSRDDFVLISKAILFFIFIDGIWPGLPPIQQFFGERAVGINGVVLKYYLAFAISIVFILRLVADISKVWRLIAIIVLFLVIYRAIVYETRAAWLALIIITFLGFVRLPRRHLLLGVAVVAVIIGSFFFIDAIINNAYETQRVISAFQLNDRDLAVSGDRIRFVSSYFGWNIFKERPILGWGPGIFSELMNNYANEPSKYVVGRAFNSWLLLMVENGIVGLVSYMMAFIVPFVITWRNLKETSTDLHFLVFSFSLGVLGTGIHLAFIDLLYTSQVWFHVALALAGAQIVIIENKKNSSPPVVFIKDYRNQARRK